MWENIVKFFKYVLENYLWLFIVICVCVVALIILLILITVDVKKAKKRKKGALEENSNKPEPEPEYIEPEQEEEKAKEPANVKAENKKRGVFTKGSIVNKTNSIKKQEVSKKSPKKEEPKDDAEENKGTSTGKYRLLYEKENKSWVIRKDGASRTIRRLQTKKEALEILENMQKGNEDLKVIVHKKNGKFQKKDSYTRSYNKK